MYEILKYVIKGMLPKNLIRDHKRTFRNLWSHFYKGKKYQCNICKIKLRRFITLKSNALLCPRCGSLPRSRGLWNIVEKILDNKIVLHFSPPYALKNVIEKTVQVENYITTDYEGEFVSEFMFNIENIDLQNDAVDVIICYHVLEHIDDDKIAMQELYRILKPGGFCFVQTPFREGSILEDKTITSPQERLERYGQEDHVRIYSPRGLKIRLEDAGFQAKIVETHNEVDNYCGLKTIDIFIHCHKIL